ncbi:MAG: hypothetical protein Q4G22_04870 [Paracoccus sp. (in: a-proteobacteria)]|uniref:hypothetical protein n=1 Tax=Paracoccus sp. TaxID=267 RepID=UPI0026DEAA82|nr:hypothetical protein [Paracoccus sp. (in: a-proteobacteria)]MDO5631152.1 hypothetical protein [Paracoccus sp. (in: a-proteobacteria)]
MCRQTAQNRAMPFGRILDRDRNNLLMTAPVADPRLAGPRLRALYPLLPQFAGWTSQRQAEFLTARALVMRGMRIFGQTPRPVLPAPEAPPDWGEGITGSISYAAGQVGVWLSRSVDRGPGLNLLPITGGPDMLTAAEIRLLDHLPGLARMAGRERLAAAVSAKRALVKALAVCGRGRFSPGCAEVVLSDLPGVTLSLTHDLGVGLWRGTRFRVGLRVLPGLVMTQVSVPCRPGLAAVPCHWH